MRIVLALDIGTSKIAAVAFDADARKTIAVCSVNNTAAVSDLSDEKHEQSPEIIAQTCVKLLGQLIELKTFAPEAVETLAISGQMHGVLLVDRDLRAVTNLITWCDQRAVEFVASLDGTNWPAERTGCTLHSGYGGATLAMLKKENTLSAGVRALSIADYVAARLCGVIATDASHAASWGIMDIRNQCWDRELVDRLGVPQEILPEIKPGLSELGPVTLELGLPGHVTVRLPLGDNQAAYIGACGLDFSALLLNLGTGGQIAMPSQDFLFRPELETRPLPFGGYLQVGASLCGGRAYAVLKEFFGETVRTFTDRALTDGELYAVMDRVMAGPGPEVAVDTRLAGTRGDPAVRGMISGLGLENFTPAALCRGFARGMVAELANMAGAETATRFDRVVAAGNAVRKNPTIPLFITEALGVPCVLAENREEAASGAALAAAHASGLL